VAVFFSSCPLPSPPTPSVSIRPDKCTFPVLLSGQKYRVDINYSQVCRAACVRLVSLFPPRPESFWCPPSFRSSRGRQILSDAPNLMRKRVNGPCPALCCRAVQSFFFHHTSLVPLPPTTYRARETSPSPIATPSRKDRRRTAPPFVAAPLYRLFLPLRPHHRRPDMLGLVFPLENRFNADKAGLLQYLVRYLSFCRTFYQSPYTPLSTPE